MRNFLLIGPGYTVQSNNAYMAGSHQSNNPPVTAVDLEQKGDLLIQDLWEQGNDCILDMRVVSTDVASYVTNMP